MRLLTKITINYFIITLIVFVIGGLAAYWFIWEEIQEKVDWKLRSEQKYIQHHANSLSDLSNQTMNISSVIEIVPLAHSKHFHEELKDTLIYDSFRHEAEPFRQLSFSCSIHHQPYKIILRKNMVESQDLKEGLTRAIVIILLSLLLVLIIANYFMSTNIWSSFNKTIQKINKYDLTRSEILQLPSAHITELDELNNAIRKMSEKVRNDYLSLKEFTENASHEIQTPLSIIKSKIELLYQKEGLKREQLTHIQAIDQAATKLSRLNHSLLLLTKIENRQFEEDEQIDFKSLLDNQLIELDEFIQLQQITLEKQIENTRIFRMNTMLADILLRNLLTNAFRYCNKPGIIKVNLDSNQLTIANNGAPLKINNEQIFDRFKKDNQSSESLGLGLAIVKKICDLYNFNITYSYLNSFHTFTISF